MNAESNIADPHVHHHLQSSSGISLSTIMTGIALTGAAIVLAPHILPSLGVGEEAAKTAMQASMIDSHGLADGVNKIISGIPLIGEKLLTSSSFSAATIGTVGIGGILLGNFIEKHDNGTHGLNWGKIIRYTALAATALISLPTVLTGIANGLVFFAALTKDTALAENMAGVMSKTLGLAMHNHAGGAAALGIASIIPHIFTCGMPFISTLLGAHLWQSPADEKENSFVQKLTPENYPEQKYSDGSINAAITTATPPIAGSNCKAYLQLTHKNGTPLTPDELAIVHTKKLHLFVVDPALQDYHHIHPEPTERPGIYEFSFMPKTSNSYNVWSDFTLKSDNTNHKLLTTINSPISRNIVPFIRSNNEAEKNGLHVHWNLAQPLQQNQASMVDFTISDKDGNPVTNLEPIMGAFAHLVGFSADGKSIIHTHPVGVEPNSADAKGGPVLQFHIEPDNSGATQFYLQIKQNGVEQYIGFGQQIKPPERNVDKIQCAMGGHQH